MGYIVSREREVWSFQHWNGLEVRRENDQIRSATIPYDVYCTRGPELLLGEADAAIGMLSDPIILGNLFRSNISLEQVSHNKWEAIVEYTFKNVNEYAFSFDTTGGTQKLTQSYETVGRFAPDGETPPNHYGAIGVSDKGIDGCDVIMPTLSFTMSHTRNGILDLDFIRSVADLTGKVNSAYFLSFVEGTVLFEGASGSQKFTSEDFPTFDLTYKFRVSPTVYNMPVGDIHVDVKRGWDYFWVQYEEIDDEEAGSIVKYPIAAFTERVYHDADLNILL